METILKSKPYLIVVEAIKMSTIYQVVRKVKNEKTNTEKNENHGFYRWKSDADQTAKKHNDWIIRRLVHDAARMTGIVRGVNAQHFSKTLDNICNPPYSVIEHRLQN